LSRLGFGLLLAAELALAGAGVGLAWVLRRERLWLFAALPAAEAARAGGLGLLAGAGAACLVLAACYGMPAYRRALEAVVLPVFRRILPVQLAVASVTAGVAEEMFFRGALQPSLGVVLTAALFGLVHWFGQPGLGAYGVTAGAIGLVFGLAYQATGTLMVPVVAHASYNGLITVLLARGALGPWRN